MSYRELPVPPDLRPLVEAAWTSDNAGATRVLPDGCMDLLVLDAQVTVAGPDTRAYLHHRGQPARGLRFRPGVLPRLLAVPAAELRNARVPLSEVRRTRGDSLTAITRHLAAQEPAAETTPWELPTLAAVARRLTDGGAVADIAEGLGWSPRTLQRHCGAVFGYSPATARRVLRFRHATWLLRSGRAVRDVVGVCGYSDQPHLYREVRELAGIPLPQLISGSGERSE